MVPGYNVFGDKGGIGGEKAVQTVQCPPRGAYATRNSILVAPERVTTRVGGGLRERDCSSFPCRFDSAIGSLFDSAIGSLFDSAIGSLCQFLLLR